MAANWGDCGSYNGTVVQLRTSSPELVASWATRANGGGIWAQGGIAGDGESLYLTTGNTFNASTWSDGEAIIRLRPASHTPPRQRLLCAIQLAVARQSRSGSGRHGSAAAQHRGTRSAPAKR